VSLAILSPEPAKGAREAAKSNSLVFSSFRVFVMKKGEE